MAASNLCCLSVKWHLSMFSLPQRPQLSKHGVFSRVVLPLVPLFAKAPQARINYRADDDRCDLMQKPGGCYHAIISCVISRHWGYPICDSHIPATIYQVLYTLSKLVEFLVGVFPLSLLCGVSTIGHPKTRPPRL
jgi:hypothetical protein